MHVLILTTCKIQLSFMYTHTTMVKLLLSTSEKNSLHQNQHQTSPWGSFSFLNAKITNFLHTFGHLQSAAKNYVSFLKIKNNQKFKNTLHK